MPHEESGSDSDAGQSPASGRLADRPPDATRRSLVGGSGSASRGTAQQLQHRQSARQSEPAEAPDTGESNPTAADSTSTEVDATQVGPRTRLQSGVRKEKVYTDGTIKYKNSWFTESGEPTTDLEALKDRNWKIAMDLEYDALVKNKTWHLVPPQRGKNVIGCKWVYKIKRKADGTLDRYKASLVAKGFKQRYGIDYEAPARPPIRLPSPHYPQQGTST